MFGIAISIDMGRDEGYGCSWAKVSKNEGKYYFPCSEVRNRMTGEILLILDTMTGFDVGYEPRFSPILSSEDSVRAAKFLVSTAVLGIDI